MIGDFCGHTWMHLDLEESGIESRATRMVDAKGAAGLCIAVLALVFTAAALGVDTWSEASFSDGFGSTTFEFGYDEVTVTQASGGFSVSFTTSYSDLCDQLGQYYYYYDTEDEDALYCQVLPTGGTVVLAFSILGLLAALVLVCATAGSLFKSLGIAPPSKNVPVGAGAVATLLLLISVIVWIARAHAEIEDAANGSDTEPGVSWILEVVAVVFVLTATFLIGQADLSASSAAQVSPGAES